MSGNDIKNTSKPMKMPALDKLAKATEDTPMGTEMVDVVTGFRGICIAKVAHLTGCTQFYLCAGKYDINNKLASSEAFDYTRLRITGKGVSNLFQDGEPAEKPATGKKDTPGADSSIVLKVV